MRLPHIDRKRAVVGWVAFVIARKVARRKVRQKLRGMKPAALDRLKLSRA
jgi:hypothetical protein